MFPPTYHNVLAAIAKYPGCAGSGYPAPYPLGNRRERRQIENDPEKKSSLQEPKDDSAGPVYTSEEGNFQDYGKKVADEGKEEADRQEDA